MGKPSVPQDPPSRLFWMLGAVITTKKLEILSSLLHKIRTIPNHMQNYSWRIQEQEWYVFALAASVFKRLKVSKLILPVKLQLCPQCVQELRVQHLSSQYTPVHPNPHEDKYSRNLDNCSRTKEQLGCHEYTWKLPSTRRDALVPSRIICSQFLTWVSCSGFIFP